MTDARKRIPTVRWFMATALSITILTCAEAYSPLAPGKHRVAVNGVTLSYFVAGAGPVMVVQPGGPGLSYEVYRPFLRAIEERATVVYLNPRGAGDSGNPTDGDYSIEAMAADLEALRLTFGLIRLNLLGHSHGSLVSLQYGSLYPEHVGRMVLSGGAHYLGAPWLREREQAMKLHPRFTDYLAAQAEGKSPMEAQMMLDFYRYEDQLPKLAPIAPFLMIAEAPNRYFATHEMQDFDLRGQLSSLAFPILLLWGEYDCTDPAARAEKLAAALPSAKLVIFKEAAHLCFIERAGEFTTAVLDFLTETR